MVNEESGGWFFVAFVMVVLAWNYGSSTTSVRVQEDQFCVDASCSQKVSGARYKLVLSQNSGSAAISVDRIGGQSFQNVDIGYGARILTNCVFVDDSNWQCTYGSANNNVTLQMLDGKFTRTGSFGGGYVITGVTGWRYWLSRVMAGFGD